MPPAVAIAGAAVVGGAAQMITGNKAAKAQRQSAELSVAEQRRQYDQSRADMMPWMTAGQSALTRLQQVYGLTPSPAGSPYGGFETSPGYQFRRDEGLKAVERSAAARGLLGSGATMKGIDRYAEGLAASEYDSYASRLAQLAGLGQGATAQTGALGASATNNITQALLASGNARASSYANTGSAINGTLNNLVTAYLFNKGGGFGSTVPMTAGG